ncbi:MAG: hypothetical protein ACOY94_27755 [Bacillota bacterium]
MAAAGEANIFPTSATLIWTLLNLLLLLLIPATMVYGVYLLVQLNRRVKALEERLNEKEK